MLLCVFVGTAWADITQNYYKGTDFWEDATSVPAGVETVLESAEVGDPATKVKKEGGVIQWSNNTIRVTADGSVTVTFTHSGGEHMLNILGVDIIDAEGNVVASDYHYGTAGGNPTNYEYTLENLTEGSELTLRSFVYDNTGTNDRTRSAQGYYTITNADGEARVVLKPIVDLATGKYILRQAGGDVACYNGTDVARGKAVADAGDVNHVFTITKGTNGCYTIQSVDGKFITYQGTGNSSTIEFLDESSATDANKWWVIREGNNTGQRVIVPSTNDVYDAPGWNYAKTVNNLANRAVALWNSTGDGSQWYITQAPVMSEGYAKLKIANVYASSNDTRVIKKDGENSTAIFKFTRDDVNGCYTIQTFDGKYLTYKSNSENGDQIEFAEESAITDDNKWWVITYDLGTRKNGAIDIIPYSTNLSASSPAFNWSVTVVNKGANTGLGFWNANNDNSYCTAEWIVTPEVGSLIAFSSASANAYCSGKYVKTVPVVTNYEGAGYSANRDHTQLVFDNCDPAVTPSAVFEVIKGTTAIDFKLKNVHTQEYVTSFVKGATHMGVEGTAVAITFSLLGDNQIAVYGANDINPMHAQEAYNVIVSWSAELNNSSAWYIEEVDAVAHKLTIGDAGWSSLVLGFNVTIPENVEVYAVSEIGTDVVTLERVTGVLPANTAVLVKATPGDYAFTYTEETGDVVASALEGTLYDVNVTPEANTVCYVLAKDEEGIGFYKATLNKNETGADGTTHFLNNANKAYLVVEGASEARFLSFDFGNETAIDELKGENGNVKTVIYDLAGRRVQKAQKGLYIVNGAKVIK